MHTVREGDGNRPDYYRTRYYHPRLQRFISEDPIGFRGGDANLHSYVFNNPTRSTDWSGKGPIAVATFIACVGYDLYDAFKTTIEIRQLAAEVTELKAQIQSLEVLCSTGRGTDRELEKLRDLQKQALEKSRAQIASQIKDYAPNIALGFACAALLALPY